jgi:hypothetical protein
VLPLTEPFIHPTTMQPCSCTSIQLSIIHQSMKPLINLSIHITVNPSSHTPIQTTNHPYMREQNNILPTIHTHPSNHLSYHISIVIHPSNRTFIHPYIQTAALSPSYMFVHSSILPVGSIQSCAWRWRKKQSGVNKKMCASPGRQTRKRNVYVQK